MWRSFLSTPSLLLLPLGRAYIGAASISCISIVGHFEISQKSNSVRTRGHRDAKFSQDVGLEVRTRRVQNGVAAMLGGAMLGVSARCRWKKFLNAIYSGTAADIAAVLSLLRAPLGSLPSALTSWGLRPPFGGQVPQPKICVGGP